MSLPPHRCPTGHRNVEDVGVSTERDGPRARLFLVIEECRDCGQRFRHPFRGQEIGRREPLEKKRDAS
jgi:hypothetical protein